MIRSDQRTGHDKRVKWPLLVLRDTFDPSLPKRLRSRDSLRQGLHFRPGRFVIAIDNNVAHSRHLASLNLEVPHAKPVSGVDVQEIASITSVHIARGTLQNLIWGDGTLELAVRQVASSLDDGNATNGFRDATK